MVMLSIFPFILQARIEMPPYDRGCLRHGAETYSTIMRLLVLTGAFVSIWSSVVLAHAEEPGINGAEGVPTPWPPKGSAPDSAVAPEPPKDIREEVPLVNYTTSAFGASRLSVGALVQA